MDGAAIPTPYLQQSSIEHMLLAIIMNKSESSPFSTASFCTVVFGVRKDMTFSLAWPCFFLLYA